VQFELVQHELSEAKIELAIQKKKPKKQKVLPLYTRRIERHGGAVWWSPSSKQEADARDRANEAYQEQLELGKATKRELQQTQKLLQQKEKEEKQARRAVEKEERARVRAVKDAEVAERRVEKQREKQARDAQKALQLPKTGNRKASQSTAPRKKQNHGGVGGGSQPIAHDRSPTPPLKFNSRGRKIAPPKRFQ
jgi:hypothetical protein